MAAFTSIMAATGLAMGAVQTVDGISQRKKAQKRLDNLEVPEVENVYKDMPISTVGSDIMREETARTNASLIDAAQSGGTRSVWSAVPQIMAFNNKQNQQTRKYLDDQVINREYAIAGDNRRMQGVEENRYQGEVQGLGQAMEVGNQNAWNGVGGMMSSLSYGAMNGAFEGKGTDVAGVGGVTTGFERTVHGTQNIDFNSGDDYTPAFSSPWGNR